MITYHEKMTVKVLVYDKIKYDVSSKKVAECIYNIKSCKLICGGVEAEKIEAETDADGIDIFHEYIVLELENGETSTFRNSYVDVFRET